MSNGSFPNEKVDIENSKVDIESSLYEKCRDFSAKTTDHINKLFEKFGFDEVFGRSAVIELLGWKSQVLQNFLSICYMQTLLPQCQVAEKENISSRSNGYSYRKLC